MIEFTGGSGICSIKMPESLVHVTLQSLVVQTSAVYQLQRRVRTLREQLQRRDIHLDLLRRKLSLQEENGRVRSMLETERDEANLRLVDIGLQIALMSY
jgi:hypothetical protein